MIKDKGPVHSGVAIAIVAMAIAHFSFERSAAPNCSSKARRATYIAEYLPASSSSLTSKQSSQSKFLLLFGNVYVIQYYILAIQSRVFLLIHTDFLDADRFSGLVPNRRLEKDDETGRSHKRLKKCSEWRHKQTARARSCQGKRGHKKQRNSCL